MKQYEKPIMNDLNLSMESVYAASGGAPNVATPTPIPVDPQGDWDICTRYCNHNTGTHSEVEISARHHGKYSGEHLKMHFRTDGIKFRRVKDSSGFAVSDVTSNGFTITRNNHFNPTDNVVFNIQITCEKEDGTEGAVGTTGVFMPCSIVCDSYESF